MCIPLRNYTKDGLRRYTLNAFFSFLSFYYGQNVFCTFTSEIKDYYYYYITSPVNWIVFPGSYKMSSKINVASAGDQAEQGIRPIC